MSDHDRDQAHKHRMQELQAAHRAKIKQRRAADGGLVLVHTGEGKGKSTAALGTMIRALGWGQRVAMVQFIKGTWKTGERAFFARFDDLLDWYTMGEGFTWDTQDRARDIAAARAAWQQACTLMRAGEHDLVVLDEINIVLRYGYLDPAEVAAQITARAPHTSVIATGRDAPPQLCAIADMVSEVVSRRHPFDHGLKAKRGIDF